MDHRNGKTVNRYQGTCTVLTLIVLVGFFAGRQVAAQEYTITDLGDLGGGQALVYGMNDAGQAVGFSTFPHPYMHAFAWLPEPAYGLPAGMTDLAVLTDTTVGRGRAINDLGQIVGMGGFFWQFEAACGLPAGATYIPAPSGFFWGKLYDLTSNCEFVGEALGDAQNFVVQPFVDLLEEIGDGIGQVIVTGAAFDGLDHVSLKHLTKVHVS